MARARAPLAVLTLACLALPSPAADQGRLTLPQDPKAQRKFEALQDYVKSEDWETAA